MLHPFFTVMKSLTQAPSSMKKAMYAEVGSQHTLLATETSGLIWAQKWTSHLLASFWQRCSNIFIYEGLAMLLCLRLGHPLQHTDRRERTSTVRCLESMRCTDALPPALAPRLAAAAAAAASVTYSPAYTQPGLQYAARDST